MIKKFMALIIALLFVFSVSGFAFAENEKEVGKKQSLSGTKFCKGKSCGNEKDPGGTATAKKTTSKKTKKVQTKNKYQAK
jgi:hypothetical protein